MEQHELTKWKQQKKQTSVQFLLGANTLSHLLDKLPFRMSYLSILLANSTKPVSAAVFPGHQGSHMFCLMATSSSSFHIQQGWESLCGGPVSLKKDFSGRVEWCSDWHLLALDALSSLLDLLLWIPRSCQLCGGRNYESPFSYHLFSTRSVLSCLTYLGRDYTPVRSRHMNVSLRWINSTVLLLPWNLYRKHSRLQALGQGELFTALFSHCSVEQGPNKRGSGCDRHADGLPAGEPRPDAEVSSS